MKKTRINNHKRYLFQERGVEQFSEHFYRVRKNLVLFSSLLFAWALIGLKISSNVTDPVASEPSKYLDFKITISSPEVFPIVLAIIVIYFIFRLFIEWYHCSIIKRTKTVSKIDFYSSVGIGSISIVLFLIQSLLNVKLANYINQKYLSGFMIAIIIGELFGLSYRQLVQKKTKKIISKISAIIYLLAGILIAFFYGWIQLKTSWNIYSIIIYIIAIISSFYFFTRVKILDAVARYIIVIPLLFVFGQHKKIKQLNRASTETASSMRSN